MGDSPGLKNRWRRPWVIAAAAAVVLVLALGAAAGTVWWRHVHSGQGMLIPEGAYTGPEDVPPPGASSEGAVAPEHRFVAAVDPSGRFFLDQAGDPILVQGDSPWSLLTDVAPDDAETYFRVRAEQGFNAAIVSLVGAEANGAPSDDGATYDGVLPFGDEGVLDWNPPYWDRAHDYLRIAAERGVTVFLYPIDGWTVGHAFSPRDQGECRAFGEQVALWARDLPNIVWMTGGDYFPVTNEPEEGSDVDRCMSGALDGIRATGDDRPFSIQLGYQKSISSDNPYWADRVDFDFVYTYYPTYRAVREAYGRLPARPALFGEGNYDGLNLQPETPDTTDETLRRQYLWAVTSGSPGAFYGTADWRFEEGWPERLSRPGTTQLSRLAALVASLPWWELVPDVDGRLVTDGAGTEVQDDTPLDVLESDFATAALTADGSTALVYVPTARTIGLDVGAVAPQASAFWVDPASATAVPTELSASMTTPGRNSAGAEDWLLVVTTAEVAGVS